MVEVRAAPSVEKPTPDTAVLPPGPRLPMPVQTALWMCWPTGFPEYCRARYGEVFAVRLPGTTLINIADPALVREVFTADADVLRAGESNATIIEPLLGPNSLLVLDGADHRRQRRLLTPPFHGARMKSYADVMRTVTEQHVAAWPRARQFPLRPAMQEITFEVILRAVFGVEQSAARAELGVLLRSLLRGTNLALMPGLQYELGGLSPWARFLRRRDRVDAALYAEIERRRADPQLADRDDVLSLLLQARDEQGRPMADRELRDELLTLLLAGHETTANTLAWCFDLLLHHPAALARLADELAAGETGYLDAVITETLRLRPVTPVVARLLRASIELAGYRLPAGVVLAPNAYLIHRDPDRYPDPAAFRPERFLGSAPDPANWLPFGGGIRRCLGASFATYEMRIVLPTVLQHVGLRAAQPRPARIRRATLALFVPIGGVPVTVADTGQ
jgi:cytochrome P450